MNAAKRGNNANQKIYDFLHHLQNYKHSRVRYSRIRVPFQFRLVFIISLPLQIFILMNVRIKSPSALQPASNDETS